MPSFYTTITRIIALLVLPLAAWAQQPLSRQWQGQMPAPAAFAMPAFNLDSARQQAAQQEGHSKRLIFGHEHRTAIDAHLQAEGWYWLPDSSARIWRGLVSSAGAQHLNLVLSRFRMGPHSHVDFYAPGYEGQLPRLTALDNNEGNRLGTWFVPGSQMVIELVEDRRDLGLNQLTVGRVVHAFYNLLGQAKGNTDGFNTSGACNINMVCPQTAGWEDLSRAVGIIIEGNAACSGSLINNTRRDGRPLFLTANHCFSNQVPVWVFGFNWKSSTCTRGAVPDFAQSISGARLLARNGATDFMLLELARPVPAQFDAFFAGWNRDGASPNGGVMIHHPSGDVMKWSQTSNNMQAAMANGGTVSAWQIQWSQGTTEGGSSGSAFFNNQQQIVGQLFGGTASCSKITDPDYIGRFDLSWDGGNTPATRLKDWLDPDNTGATSLSGDKARCMAQQRLPYIERFDHLPALTPLMAAGLDSAASLSAAGCPPANEANVLRNDLLSLASLSTGKALVIRARRGLTGSARQDFLSPGLNLEGFDSVRVRMRLAAVRVAGNDQLTLGACAPCGGAANSLNLLDGKLAYVNAAAINAGLTDAHFSLIDTTIATSQLPGNRLRLYLRTSGVGTYAVVDSLHISGTYSGMPAFDLPDAITLCEGDNAQLALKNLLGTGTVLWSVNGATPSSALGAAAVFNFPNAGNYNATVTVTTSAGFTTRTANALVVVKPKPTATLPVNQTFVTSGTMVGWANYATNGTSLWMRTSTAGNLNLGSLWVNNYNGTAEGQRNFFISPAVDLTTLGSPMLRFAMAHAPYRSRQDSLLVAYTTDCGASFHPLWKKGSSQMATAAASNSAFVPTGTQWKTYSLNLGPDLGALTAVQFAFIGISAGGNNVYLDDIEILDQSCGTGGIAISANTPCEGDPLILTGPMISGAVFNWQGPDGWSSSAQAPVRPVATPGMSGTYQLLAERNGCTELPATTQVTVLPLPGKPAILPLADSAVAIYASAGTAAWYDYASSTPFALGRKAKMPVNPSSGAYEVRLRILGANGCNSDYDYYNSLPTGARAQQSAERVVLYPNPASAQFSLSGPVSQWTLTDLQGRQLMQGRDTQGIGTRQLPRGIYLVRAQTPSGWQNLRLVLAD